MGPVYRAHDVTERRLVAVKVFRLDLAPAQAEDLAAALQDTIDAGRPHPAIAEPLAAGVEGVSPWLAQQYVAADALDAVLRQYGPPPMPTALAALRRVASALDHAAGLGVFHGTLHPRDVLGVPDDVRIIDLGVAQALGRLGLRVPVRRPYSAPERVEGAEWTRAADIFSLAAIAFEVLTGRRIAGAGDQDLPAGILRGADDRLLGEVFARSLAERVDERPATATQFVEALESALADALPSDAPTPRRRVRRVRAAAPRLPLEPPDLSAATAAMVTPASPPVDLPLHVTAAAPELESPVESPFESPIEPPIESSIESSIVNRQPSIDDVPVPMAPSEGPAALAMDELDQTRPADEPDEVHAPAVDEFQRPEAAVALDVPASPEVPAPAEVAVASAGPDLLSDSPIVNRQSSRGLAAGVVLGLVLGFAAGYWVARPPASPTPVATAPPVATEALRDEVIPPPGPAASGTVPAATSPVGGGSRPDGTPGAAPAAVARRGPGRLTFRSTPPGAWVEIDGVRRGTTPLTVRDLPTGMVSVRVGRDGYRPDERRIAITTRRPSATINARLVGATPAGSTGSLLVESRPPGARVMVDGRPAGVTPLRQPKVAAGRHEVRIELSGHRPWTTTVEVAGGPVRVAASLERTPER